MGNVIDFLARLGGDASLRHASDETLAAKASESGLDDACGDAIRTRNPDLLRDLMGLEVFFSTQMGEPLHEDEEPSDDEGDEDDGDEGDNPLKRRGPTPPPGGSRH